jgi:hypothetical protein
LPSNQNLQKPWTSDANCADDDGENAEGASRKETNIGPAKHGAQKLCCDLAAKKTQERGEFGEQVLEQLVSVECLSVVCHG